MKLNEKELVTIPNGLVLSHRQHRCSNYHSISRICSSMWEKIPEQPGKENYCSPGFLIILLGSWVPPTRNGYNNSDAVKALCNSPLIPDPCYVCHFYTSGLSMVLADMFDN